MGSSDQLTERISSAERLIATIESSPEGELRTAALDLVQTLMDFHGAAIERMMDVTAEQGVSGFALFERYASDDIVSNLLMLYGLHPLSIEERVQQAIEDVKPTLNLHDGGVDIIALNDGKLTLKLTGNCRGCPSSAVTLRSTIEDAIRSAAPDILSIDVVDDNVETTDGLVQIERKISFANCEFATAA